VASRLASILVSAFVLYSGYIVPYFNMKKWIRWIYWINPLNYGFAALMDNEFKRVNLDCVGQYITPRNLPGLTKYPNVVGPNQVCTLQGAAPGTQIVAGTDYIKAGFAYYVNDQWRDWGFLIVFFIAFLLMQMGAMEYFKHGADMPAITVFSKENKERKALNATLLENKERYRKGEAEQDLSSMSVFSLSLSLEASNLTIW
jgi:ATP-binding cassette subfamily G (WHITE) protein 2 (SNQ2)